MFCSTLEFLKRPGGFVYSETNIYSVPARSARRASFFFQFISELCVERSGLGKPYLTGSWWLEGISLSRLPGSSPYLDMAKIKHRLAHHSAIYSCSLSYYYCDESCGLHHWLLMCLSSKTHLIVMIKSWYLC